MKFNQDAIDEINVLLQFDLSNSQQGIKIHHIAEPALIAAAGRLHSKGLIDHSDGGYLTAMGRAAAEHAQAMFSALSVS